MNESRAWEEGMGAADWSLDQLERELAANFVWLGKAEGEGGLAAGESAALAEGVLRCMNGALSKVSESLEAQAALRRELERERDEFRRAQAQQALRIRSMERELAALRASLNLERAAAAGPPLAPPDEHLRRPLVLRTAQGDFLGVTGRDGRALSLSGFLRLVEGASQRSERVVASCWEAGDKGWSLTLSISGVRSPRCYVLGTRATRTPSGNHVVVLAEMLVDGRVVPQEYVLQMFRQLREGAQE